MNTLPGLAGLAVALLLAVSPAHAQQSVATLTGTVTDLAGAPVEGVLVFLDGAPPSTTTNARGAFVLEAPPGARAVDFRADGFRPVTVPVRVGADAIRDLGVTRLAPGPAPTAAIVGAVTSESGEPLADVEVRVNGAVHALTDANGDFSAMGVPIAWGDNIAGARRFAYGDAAEGFWVADDGQTVRLRFSMPAVPVAVDGVLVEGDADVSDRLPGFREREASTSGYFIDRDEILRRDAAQLSYLLRVVPGLSTYEGPSGVTLSFSRRTRSFGGQDSECGSPLVFMDGILLSGGRAEAVDFDDLASPQDVAGIEAYSGAARIPTQFNTAGSGCGVLAIWTMQAELAPAPYVPQAIRPRDPGAGWRRAMLIGAVAVPLAGAVLYTAICSLPHYC